MAKIAQPATCGHGTKYSRGLCVKCYNKLPEVKEKHNCKMRKYFARPEIKERRKQLHSTPEWKEKNKKYLEKYWSTREHKKYTKKNAAIGELLSDFFKHFVKRLHDEQELLKTAEIYSKTACNLTHKQQCTLEEKILLKISTEKIMYKEKQERY